MKTGLKINPDYEKVLIDLNAALYEKTSKNRKEKSSAP